MLNTATKQIARTPGSKFSATQLKIQPQLYPTTPMFVGQSLISLDRIQFPKISL